MGLLSKEIAKATGYSEDEAKQILLKKMDKKGKNYLASIKADAINPDSWAAITLCYATSDPSVFIKEVGKKSKKS